MKYFKYTFLLLLSICSKVNAQDIITKTDNTEFKGKIIEISNTELRYKKFENLDGPTVVLPIVEVKSIKYPNGLVENYNNQNQKTGNTEKSFTTIQTSGLSSGFTNKDEAKNEFDKNGIKQGKWIEYLTTDGGYNFIDLPNQVTASYYRLLIYKDGNYNGIERLYEMNDKLVMETDYNKGRGIHKTYYANGNLQNEMPFLNGKIDGIWKMYYDNGKPLAENTFVNGERNGSQKTFGKDGNISRNEFITATKEPKKEILPDKIVGDKQNGLTKTYYNNGKLKSETMYMNGMINGISKTYNENEQLISEIPFTDNKMNGTSKVYYASGKLKNETPYLNNIMNGSVKFFYENGQLQTETKYSNGKIIDGVSHATYYETGGIASAMKYLNNEVVGNISFYKNGNVLTEVEMTNLKMNGMYKTYYESGKLMSERPYIDNKVTGIEKRYSEETGHVITETTWKNSEIIGTKDYEDWIQDGTLVKLYKSGVVYSETQFTNGKKNGYDRIYYEGGQIEFQSFYVNGVQKGETKLYRQKKKNMTEADLQKHKELMKAVRKSMIADLKNPSKWVEFGATVGQAVQQNTALNNMTKNTNTETISAYTQIVQNNYDNKLSSVDALNKNNQILESSSINNSQIKPESVASSTATSSGKDGNSPEAKACAKEAQRQYETTTEYHNFFDNRNNIESAKLRNGELAKAKQAEILLTNCGQYLNDQEKNMLKSLIENCKKTANDLKGNTIEH